MNLKKNPMDRVGKKVKKPAVKRRISFRVAIVFTFVLFSSLGVLLYAYSDRIAQKIAASLVYNQEPAYSDAAVVLHTQGVEYYPRLTEAAKLFREGFVKRIIINGNRTADLLKQFESSGFAPCCPWYEDSVRILSVLGVPRDQVTAIAISSEDVYDTSSEAEAVGRVLAEEGIQSVILVTSKSHTRRAYHIWKQIHPNRFQIHVIAAETDPYTPETWWKDGRQIRWTLWEYGAWLFYFWKQIAHVAH
jgi:uncharacterized SAM-binding protein YcdF (DUF218 family)